MKFLFFLQTMRRHRNEVTVELRKVSDLCLIKKYIFSDVNILYNLNNENAMAD